MRYISQLLLSEALRPSLDLGLGVRTRFCEAGLERVHSVNSDRWPRAPAVERYIAELYCAVRGGHPSICHLRRTLKLARSGKGDGG